jgi:hypothetical protein
MEFDRTFLFELEFPFSAPKQATYYTLLREVERTIFLLANGPH